MHVLRAAAQLANSNQRMHITVLVMVEEGNADTQPDRVKALVSSLNDTQWNAVPKAGTADTGATIFTGLLSPVTGTMIPDGRSTRRDTAGEAAMATAQVH
jgi:hypothetical protein